MTVDIVLKFEYKGDMKTFISSWTNMNERNYKICFSDFLKSDLMTWKITCNWWVMKFEVFVVNYIVRPRLARISIHILCRLC